MSVTRSYFICAAPRMGGSLLCEALESTRLAGIPQEYFEPTTERDWRARLGISADSEFFAKVLAAGSTPNGVFGAKVIWPQFEHLIAKLRGFHEGGTSDADLLGHLFPGLRYVFLTRNDKLRQAISYDRAIRSGVWHSIGPDAVGCPESSPAQPIETPAFDFQRLDFYVRYFNQCEASWRSWFAEARIEPLEIVYEEFAQAYVSTVGAILGYLEVPISAGFHLAPPRLLKLADELSEEWVCRYHETKKRAKGHRAPARTSYFLSSTPRTGSFLLAEGLESTAIAGRPREYFDLGFEPAWRDRLGISTDAEYLPKIEAAGTTSNGVFGAKLHWHQFEQLTTKLRQCHGDDASDSDLLRRTFPDLRYVFLTRRDKVRQAVSYYRAIRTGVWFLLRPATNDQPKAPVPAPPFDFAAIDHWVDRLTKYELNWREYFAGLGVQPLEVVYEDFAAAFELTVQDVLRYLELPISAGVHVAPPRLVKQADELSEAWVRHYHQHKRMAKLDRAECASCD